MQLSAKRLIFLSAAKKEKGVKVRNMNNYEFYLAGSLEKVFWNWMPQVMEEGDLEHAHMLIWNLGICQEQIRFGGSKYSPS